MEAYPELQSHANVMALQQEIERLETLIARRRELFNNQVYQYNSTILQVPAAFLRPLFGWRTGRLVQRQRERARATRGRRLPYLGGDADDLTTASVAQALLAECLGDLAEVVAAIDDGGDPACLDELAQHVQVGFRLMGGVNDDPTAGDDRDQRGPQQHAELAGGRDVDAAGGQDAPTGSDGPAADEVEDEVIAGIAAGEVLGAVVDDVVGADGAHELGVAGAADAADLGPVRLGDLDREGADARPRPR